MASSSFFFRDPPGHAIEIGGASSALVEHRAEILIVPVYPRTRFKGSDLPAQSGAVVFACYATRSFARGRERATLKRRPL